MSMIERRQNRLAFTLVELLVVISIIAILLAILMPALSKTRESARTLVCGSNLKQCGMAMMMYAQDYDGKSPPDPVVFGEYWFNKLAPYLGDALLGQRAKGKTAAELSKDPELLKIIYCPTANKTKSGFDGDRRYLIKWGTAKLAWAWLGSEGSYGRNGWVYPDIPASITPAEKQRYYTRISMAKQDVPVFGDSIWVNAWPHNTDSPPRDLTLGNIQGDLNAGMGRFCIDRHNMKVNIGFVGGQVKKVDLKDLCTLSWHKTFVPTVVVLLH
jgi:prepilin-type N-terminal cleavage/methylation domain-containing protein